MDRGNMTSFETGSLAIAVAGTAEQCTAHTVPQGFPVVFVAHPSNTGYIYIGESKAKAEAHHIELGPGGDVSLRVDNVSDVWADCSVNGDTVGWILEVNYGDA